MTNTDTLEDFEIDPQIEAMLNTVLGSSLLRQAETSSAVVKHFRFDVLAGRWGGSDRDGAA
jgi:hypothetical protein